MHWSLSVILVVGALSSAYGYRLGAPEEACGDMIPQHLTPAQTSPLPFVIKVDKNEVKGGEKVRVEISGTQAAPTFKGFFVQGRVGNIPVGKFEATEKIRLVDCGDSKASGATHFLAQELNSIILTWTAPPGLSETVRFRVTVAQDGKTFWVGHLSSPVVVKSD